MNELVFRQWVKSSYEECFVYHDLSRLISYTDSWKDHIMILLEGETETTLAGPLEQFTGLLDCKGQRIFEGDIVKVCELEDVPGLDNDCDFEGTVHTVEYGIAFGYPAFDLEPCISCLECNNLNHFNECGRILVIGNIHGGVMG